MDNINVEIITKEEEENMEQVLNILEEDQELRDLFSQLLL